jgi:hypothetical protein
VSASALKPSTATRPYLTIIPIRTPREKTHTTLAHAKNAVSAKVHWSYGLSCDIAVYEWRDGDWSLLWDLPRGTLASALPWNQPEPS